MNAEVVLKKAFSFFSKGKYLSYFTSCSRLIRILWIFVLLFVITYSIVYFICFIPLQEECVLSDPQGESDADADIEDTDCRFDANKHTLALTHSSAVLVALTLQLSNLVPFTWFVQTPGARFSAANQLPETQAPAGSAAGHHGERRRWWEESQIPSLEPQAQSWPSTQQDHTGGKKKKRRENKTKHTHTQLV